jgi:beta-galactosidase
MNSIETGKAAAIRPARVNPLLRHPRERRVSLDGEWRFRLDPRDCGLTEGWFRSLQHLLESIEVPGSWQGQGFGGDEPEMVQDFGYPARTFRASYKGTGWYGRSFRIPADWSGQRLWLNFGGVYPSAEVWLNGVRLGENSLPFVPFAFDISGHIRFDADNELLVRVHEKNRIFGLAYNWQGDWSGLYRGVELSATGPCWLERCAVLPDADSGHLVLRVGVGGQCEVGAEVLLSAKPVDGSRPAVSGKWTLGATTGEFRLPVPQPLLWSPDQPNLYRVDIELRCAGDICDARSERTGFVKLEARGKEFRINGEPYYMRGTGDFVSCPETGCPDTDRERWRRKLQALRDYGYNHVRCQSFVYGPEYYDMADEVGLLIQSEMGMLGAWGGASVDHLYQWPKPTPDNYPILKEQWDMIVERDASHPSANLYCMSNEYWTNTDFPRIAWECYHQTKRLKPTAMVIWTDGGWNEDLPGDFVNHFVNMAPGLKPEELEALQKPVIQHEYAWWSSFPDVRLREKYTGALRPYTAEIAAETAARRGQAHLLEIYAVNSQHLQLIEARAKMELMRRDYPTLAGISHFNAMDANPSPQGIIDEFYEKKTVSAEEWLQINGDTVVMSSLGFDDRCLESGAELKVRFSVSDFSHPPFRDPRLIWRLRAGEVILAAGELHFYHQPFRTAAAGEAGMVMPDVEEPLALRLEASLVEGDGGREIGNSWFLWLFPPTPQPVRASVYKEPRWTWLSKWGICPG